MSLTVIVKNWGISGCAWTWKGSSESCSSEPLLSVGLVLKTAKPELEEIFSKISTIYQKEEINFSLFGSSV